MKLNIIKIIFILIVSLHYISCGRGGKSSSSNDYYVNSLSGKISSPTGSVSVFKNWLVVLINAQNGISKISTIDNTGSFNFKTIKADATYTMVLLSPDYKLNSVLAYKTSSGLYQYFKFINYSQPIKLTYKGLTFSFANQNLVEFDSRYITEDSNNNGVPDGIETSPMFNLTKNYQTNENNTYTLTGSSEDIDGDGIANSEDPDIDGDGIVNWLDDDMDNDGIPDLLDTDSNTDGVLDSTSKNNKYYFNEKLDYIIMQIVRSSGSSATQTSVIFTAKTLTTPKSIQIESTQNTFLGASVQYYNENNIVQYTNWDANLLDDGYNYDGILSDNIYARKFKLASNSAISNYQIFFIKFGSLQDSQEVFDAYPIIYPNVSIQTPTLSYTSASKTFTLSGTPFGSSLPYYEWQIWIYNSSDILVYTSAPLSAGVSTFSLPSSFQIQSGYYAIAYIQSPEIIFGYPAFILELPKISLTSN